MFSGTGHAAVAPPGPYRSARSPLADVAPGGGLPRRYTLLWALVELDVQEVFVLCALCCSALGQAPYLDLAVLRSSEEAW
jgi:hypothetical protein